MKLLLMLLAGTSWGFNNANISSTNQQVTFGGATQPITISSNGNTAGINNFGSMQVEFPAGSYDAFGKIRTSQAVRIFDSQFEFTQHPFLWVSSTSGSGQVVIHLDDSTINLTVSSSSNDFAIGQSKLYFDYRPGQSHTILASGVLGAGRTNGYSRIGYYDNYNGYYFESASDGLYIVERSSSSASLVETRISSNSFNIDKLDGTGPSGLKFDPTKTAIFTFSLEWLGAGSVFAGLYHNGRLTPVHVFNHDQITTTSYIATARLPIRYEIGNSGPSSPGVLKEICSSVLTEGDDVLHEPRFSTIAVNGTSLQKGRSIAMAMRIATSLNGKTNRGHLTLDSVEIFSASAQNAIWELYQGGSVQGGSWVAGGDTDSMAEFNTTATGMTGGRKVAAGVIGSTYQSDFAADLDGYRPLSLDFAGQVSDTYTLFINNLGNNSGDYYAVVTWRENR